ncbi:MAG TPA: hypothetical protein VIW92_16365 [Thermoanaerobaculia bacterium]
MATSSHVKRALDLFGDELTRRRNVVGLGRVPAESGDGWCLAVYVDKKLPPEELAAADMVPKTLELPGGGAKVAVRTKVIEQGLPELETL